jgi:hypothetical protein
VTDDGGADSPLAQKRSSPDERMLRVEGASGGIAAARWQMQERCERRSLTGRRLDFV